MGRYSSKNTISSYRRLDIRELQRKGFLRPGGWTSLSWSRNGDVVGSVGVCAEFDRVVLRYRHQRYGEDWKDEEYPIFLDRTPCNYGGERVWFLCPARGCSRRVAVVYGGSILLVGTATNLCTIANARLHTAAPSSRVARRCSRDAGRYWRS